MSDKLLPCPFCGGEAVMLCDMDGNFYVKCDSVGDCRAESGRYTTNTEAAHFWNLRHSELRVKTDLHTVLSQVTTNKSCFVVFECPNCHSISLHPKNRIDGNRCGNCDCPIHPITTSIAPLA
ncbi:MAG: Lar family restriction alleviation protein [Oscillospiraceae bacterium]|jgi:hypothetical protein|nr:Lar family restriction alleviation protein [Oscillospiraceae bacterium]